MKLAKSIRRNLYAIEVIELFGLGLLFSLLGILMKSTRQATNQFPPVMLFVMVAFSGVALWGVYLILYPSCAGWWTNCRYWFMGANGYAYR